jgi:uroporphyrinogen-III decarboxylase
MTHRERLLKVARGEMVDTIPWIPRIDLWHNAHALAGTLPKKYRQYSVEEIHRAEGWPLHKVIPEYLKPEKPEDIVHRAIGLYRLKEYPYDFEFSGNVEIEVAYEDSADESMTRVSYHTPVGMITVRHGITAEMKKSGASITWVKEHAIKTKDDYHTLAHVFDNLKLKPAYERFQQWKNSVGEDGVAVAQGLGIACSSPMHFIQKTLLGATDFYLHYHDYPKEMAELVEALEPVYNQLIDILAPSPADAVLWSANVDDMVTYPTYFEKDILPWCRKAARKLHARGILAIIHPDGENRGLMDLIPQCDMDIADAVTPYPMTKIDIEAYYDRWCRSGKITIQGGIPEMLLLEESATRDDLKNYMDHLLNVITPGTRFIASIGDTSPPNTEFDRLLYIGERIEKEGKLS